MFSTENLNTWLSLYGRMCVALHVKAEILIIRHHDLLLNYPHLKNHSDITTLPGKTTQESQVAVT